MGKDCPVHIPFLESYHDYELKQGKALGLKCLLKKKLFGDSDFTICLATGKAVKEGHHKYLDDIALRLECKENIGWVLNSYYNGHWGEVERYPLNVQEDELFYLRIEPHANVFKIYVNNEMMCEYKYRVPIEYTNTVYVDGNITLYRLNWETNYRMVPFRRNFQNVRPGKSIYIVGKPDKDAEVFNIDLVKDSQNIPMTLSVRMKGRHKQVIRNTMKDHKWLEEENFSDNNQAFPFTENIEFKLQIELKTNGLEVLINGRRFCEYYYREPLESIRKLHITGDVEIRSVDM